MSCLSKGNNINASWSPDGKYIAVGNKSDNLVILDVAAQKQAKKTKYTSGENMFMQCMFGCHGCTVHLYVLVMYVVMCVW